MDTVDAPLDNALPQGLTPAMMRRMLEDALLGDKAARDQQAPIVFEEEGRGFQEDIDSFPA